METSVATPSASGRYVAGPIHTISLLLILGVWAFLAWFMAGRVKAAPNPHRVGMYLFTMVAEWLVFAYVVAGVRRRGASLSLVVGDRWSSGRQLLRDVGIAAAFWVLSGGVLVLFARLLHIDSSSGTVDFMLPHGALEFALWVALSVTAGICEETIFRGYLQRQFIAFTRSSPLGIVLSAAAFGAAHAYQGWRLTILIGIYGLMFGLLAYWRGTVRPGMIVHAWQDSFSGILGSLLRH
jgi:membrane protease YdiL (CAAX protease family)